MVLTYAFRRLAELKRENRRLKRQLAALEHAYRICTNELRRTPHA